MLGSLIHDGEEHGTRCCITDKLGNESSYQTDRCHDHYRVRATDIENSKCQTFGDTCLLKRQSQHDTSGTNHQYLTIDTLHRLLRSAASEYQHGTCCEESAMEQWHHTQCREYHHCQHDKGRDEGLGTDVRQLFVVEEMKL